MAFGHSPWGQYTVYRQKHLLIMSSKSDPESYPYSEQLVEAINREEPSARARPARARDLQRCYDLFVTNQLEFMLLPQIATEEMRYGRGAFDGRVPLSMKTMYAFGDLILSVHTAVPANVVRIVTYSILEQIDALPGARNPSEMLGSPHMHIEALTAITTFLADRPTV